MKQYLKLLHILSQNNATLLHKYKDHKIYMYFKILLSWFHWFEERPFDYDAYYTQLHHFRTALLYE